jgi:hypothetical protein
MGKKANDLMMDASLDYAAGSTFQVACSAEPADYAGIAAVALADVALAGGDFTKADGDVSGRKVTVGAKSGVTIDTSGTATHIALHDGTTLRYVTTCTSLALTAGAGNTVNFPAWKIEVADPT